MRCREFPPLVLYWVLNKASSSITLNLLNMGIMLMTGVFIIWRCSQNFWWASVNMTLIWNINTKAYLKCLSHFRQNELCVKVLFPWSTSETKRWNLGLICVPHSWIKPGTQKMQFQPVLNKILCSTPPTPPPIPINQQFKYTILQK